MKNRKGITYGIVVRCPNCSLENTVKVRCTDLGIDDVCMPLHQTPDLALASLPRQFDCSHCGITVKLQPNYDDAGNLLVTPTLPHPLKPPCGCQQDTINALRDEISFLEDRVSQLEALHDPANG